MTALVIGATGLVGTELIKQLQNDAVFKKVIVFTRRKLKSEHPKTHQHVIDFNDTGSWAHLLKGDVLFSTLGTTLKAAGSKEAQYLVDYTYQYQVAKAASENKVQHYVLVSAAYASPESRVFYSRMKGELERDVKLLPFTNISIIRPGMLTGDRKEKRIGEKIGIAVLKFACLIPGLGAMKPIHASIVAKAMIKACNHKSNSVNVYTLSEVFHLANIKHP
jgi:uncharacterized protein YbjT (DUF2867 family)